LYSFCDRLSYECQQQHMIANSIYGYILHLFLFPCRPIVAFQNVNIFYQIRTKQDEI
jgi:hypothetical protein